MAEVTMDHTGLVIGLDMSRLARSSTDWHQLFELCGIFGTLLADEDGVYDANDATDRMVLGLKGIMSELELHTMRNRLHRGAMNKARRGELFHSVATGYVILPNGEVVMDLDEQVRAVMQQIFDTFDELGSVFRTFHWFARHHVALPLRCRCGSKKGELEWRRATMSRLRDVLHNPIYAGAYGPPQLICNQELAQTPYVYRTYVNITCCRFIAGGYNHCQRPPSAVRPQQAPMGNGRRAGGDLPDRLTRTFRPTPRQIDPSHPAAAGRRRKWSAAG
jgi:hypothetical protein